MYYVIKASAGDILLTKFLVIPSKFIGKFSGYDYDEILESYIDIWNYRYNKLTKETDDRLQSHAEHIDNLPWDLKKLYRQFGYWGKTDLFRDKIRFFVNIDLPRNQEDHLRRLCNLA